MSKEAPPADHTKVDRDVDYYAIIGVSPTATKAQISKAYRLKAVKLHPDKFPNDANAADKFHQLVTAKDILTDENLRQKYDALIKAKLARIERENRRTSKQREMMDKLLAGEEAHRKQREAERLAKEKFETDLQRLRKEMLQHEQDRLARARKRTKEAAVASAWRKQAAQSAVRVEWNASLGTMTETMLRDVFSQYGDVEDVVVSAKKRSAVLSFFSVASATAAVDDSVSDENFTVRWVDDAAARLSMKKTSAANAESFADFDTYRAPQHPDVINGVSVPQSPANVSLEAHLQYEKDVLALLRTKS